MPRLFQFPNPIKFDTMTLVIKLRGVDVYVHWTVLVIGILMIYGTIRQPWVTLAAGLSWLTLMLLHESGHMVAAQRKHCQVSSIDLYPIFGLCCFQVPWSKYDHCVIAWGGVIAQLLVAIPLVVGLKVFGYSSFSSVNAVLVVLGPYSLMVAVFNLLPIGRLDGAVAWRIIPEAIKRVRARKAKKASAGRWRSY
jgi:Zn-dependent protease